MDDRNQTQGNPSRSAQGTLSRQGGAGMMSRYNPFYEMQEHMRRMDALFNRVFGFEPFPSSLRHEFQQLQQMEPDTDIFENDTEYIVHAALPGLDPQDIKLEATEDSITLTAERRSPFQGGMQSDSQSGQATFQGAASQTGVAQQGTTSQSGQTGASQSMGQGNMPQQAGQGSAPHTQHRQSRYGSQTRYRMVYTPPMPIDPNAVRASFRNGILELHLPKQNPAANKPISIPINAEGASATSIGGMSQTQQGTGATTMGGVHEGSPASKMGSSYTPSAGEDHVAQAQAAGERGEHQAGRETGSVAGGQTNPASTTPGAPAGSSPQERK